MLKSLLTRFFNWLRDNFKALDWRMQVAIIAGLVVFCYFIPSISCSIPSETVVVTVVVEVTSTPAPTSAPTSTPLHTEEPEINLDSFREYADTVFNDMYDNCVGLSRKDWGTTDFTFSLLIRADAERCVNQISTHETPLNCEYDIECNQLSSLATEYTALVTEGWRLFRKGEATLDEDSVSEGLVMFWDADEMWLEIRDAVFALEDKYGWELHQ